MVIDNLRKLSLSPEVKQNLFCTLSVDFSFGEFRSFQSNAMAKGNLTNIVVTYQRMIESCTNPSQISISVYHFSIYSVSSKF
jgi:hypothetical protein